MPNRKDQKGRIAHNPNSAHLFPEQASYAGMNYRKTLL